MRLTRDFCWVGLKIVALFVLLRFIEFENPNTLNFVFVYFFTIYIYIIYKYRKTHTHFFVSNISLIHFFFVIIIFILIESGFVGDFFFSIKFLLPNHDSACIFFPFFTVLLYRISSSFICSDQLCGQVVRKITKGPSPNATSHVCFYPFDRPINLYLKITMVGQLAKSKATLFERVKNKSIPAAGGFSPSLLPFQLRQCVTGCKPIVQGVVKDFTVSSEKAVNSSTDQVYYSVLLSCKRCLR